jgi:hypothetical protein
MTGDWNWVPDDDRDRLHKHNHIHNNDDVSQLIDFTQDNQLIDTYIDTYETNEADKPIFMTYHKQSQTVMSRIDRWYHHQDLTHLICNTSDYDDEGYLTLPMPPINTDHIPVGIILLNPSINKIKQLKTIWKLNMETCHFTHIKKALQHLIHTHYHRGLRDNKWSYHWDAMKKSIKTFMRKTQHTASKINKENQEKDQLIMTNPDSTIQEITQAKNRKIHRETTKRKGQLIRYRGERIEEEDRMTKYHFALNAARFKSSQIPRLKDVATNQIATTQKSICKAVDNFWRSIFEKRIPPNEQDDIYNAQQELADDITKKLTQDQSTELDFLIDDDLTKDAINKTKLGKSPGTDGIPLDFYYYFQDYDDGIIIKFITEVFNESHNKGTLPKSMRQIQIRLLFKKTTEEERQQPKNYRPISLLNCDYKILSKILATKLSPKLKFIIDDEQTGVPGKTISEPIYTVQSIIHQINKIKQDGALIFLDFEKAFDSVDHNYTFTMMKAMNIHDNFIKWSKLGFTQTSAQCIVNGGLSSGFPLPGGGTPPTQVGIQVGVQVRS